MRVLAIGSVYPPHLLGGAEVVWQGVTRRLIAEGHDSRVLVGDFRAPEADPSAPEDPEVYRELRWYWRDHAWPRHHLRERITLERHNAAVLERHLRAMDPDVVAFWPMGGLSLSLITQVQRTGLPSVFFLHDPWPVYGPVRDAWLATFSRGLMRPLAWPGQRLTGLPTRLDLSHGRWLPNSAWAYHDAGLTHDPRQVRVLSPGVEARYLEAPPELEGPPAWGWRLLYLGRVVEQKGVLDAVEAMTHLPAEATLTILGSGEHAYRVELERRAADLGVGDRIRWRAPVDRAGTIAAYRAADAVLFPVRWGEPWGLVPLEAMALGRPVVATGRGGSGEYLRDGVNALLHPTGDAVALAEAIRHLAGDETLRQRLVAAGRDTAQAHRAEDFEREAVAELSHAARAVGGAASPGPHRARFDDGPSEGRP